MFCAYRQTTSGSAPIWYLLDSRESPRQELLEAGDTNPIDCDAGRCVLLSEDLGCQPALSDGERAWWFGMFGDL